MRFTRELVGADELKFKVEVLVDGEVVVGPCYTIFKRKAEEAK